MDDKSSEETRLLDWDIVTDMNRLYAISPHPSNPFQLSASLDKFHALYDLRYMDNPLMTWQLHDQRDPFVGLKFLDDGFQSEPVEN